MRADGKAEVQHYVPQALLRLHANDPSAKQGSHQVWCFDKLTSKVFPANIRGVMSGTRFYEVEIEGQTVSIEGPLSKIEDMVSPILTRLVHDRNLSDLTKEDHFTIARFCAVQMLRTQGFRDRIKDMNEGLADALCKRGIDPATVSNFEMLSDDDIKAFSIDMLAKAPQTYGPHFLSKHWHLIGSVSDDPFHLGDHPVAVDNDLRNRPRSFGLASPGVTIYVPLSPTLCLAMSDPALIKELFEGAQRARDGHREFEQKVAAEGFPTRRLGILESMRRHRDRMNEQIEPLETGTPSAHDPRVVMRVNSLQMLYAGRWIVSSKPDFSLPRKMLADDPSLHTRRKLVVE